MTFVLRNERHCGDVLTRKTYTPNYRDHKKAKNVKNRPQSMYYGHHEAIVSRDDYIAVQHLLDNMKYGNKSIFSRHKIDITATEGRADFLIFALGIKTDNTFT